jgi:hypothetical protein
MAAGLRTRTLYSVCALTLLIWGCPKRQTTPRLIYLPAPPAASEQNPAPPNGTLVIQAPAPPEPVQAAPPAPPKEEEKSVRRRRRTPPTERPAAEPAENTPETPPAEVPALEPHESPAQQTAQRQQIVAMLAGIQGRMAQLKQEGMSDLERKTFEDARMFLEQSQHALVTNDLVRALNLARKASLLVNALEQKP